MTTLPEPFPNLITIFLLCISAVTTFWLPPPQDESQYSKACATVNNLTHYEAVHGIRESTPASDNQSQGTYVNDLNMDEAEQISYARLRIDSTRELLTENRKVAPIVAISDASMS